MVPETGASVVVFLLLVAPGLLFDLLAQRRKVGAPESAFREVSRVALASALFSGVGIVALSVVRAVKPQWMPDPRALFRDSHAYFVARYRLILRAALIEAVVAMGSACVAHLILARGTTRLRAASGWQEALRTSCPKGYTPHARVRLADGTVYLGAVEHYTADLDLADREIVLAPPLFSKSAGGQLSAVPQEWQRLVVSGPAIHSIFVQYRPAPPASGSPTPPRLDL